MRRSLSFVIVVSLADCCNRPHLRPRRNHPQRDMYQY